jgi:hypothetical protein
MNTGKQINSLRHVASDKNVNHAAMNNGKLTTPPNDDMNAKSAAIIVDQYINRSLDDIQYILGNDRNRYYWI